MRTVCNSIANMSYNMFGYVPAPYLYGFVYDRYGGGKSHAGLYTIEVAGLLSFIFSLIMFLRKKKAFEEYLKNKDRTIPVADSLSPTNSSDSNPV